MLSTKPLIFEPGYFLPRPRDAHKGQFGHVLVIGGDSGMAGAIRLAGEAAARIGAGLVTLATRPEHSGMINALRPELLCYGILNSAALMPLLARATVIVIGPGLGQTAWAQELLQIVLTTQLPLVVDADALNLLAKDPRTRSNWILTPHPAEAARLLNISTEGIQVDRLHAVKLLQARYQGVVVLKGAGTLIQSTGMPAICQAGNPGMASAGMGDVLSGIIGGLIAQGLPLQAAAEQGVLLHATAADKAAEAGERGLLASDVIAQLRKLIN